MGIGTEKKNKEEDEKEEDGDCCKATGLSVLLSVWIAKAQLDRRNIHISCLSWSVFCKVL